MSSKHTMNTWYAAGRIEKSRKRFGLVDCSIDANYKMTELLGEQPGFCTSSQQKLSDGLQFKYSGPFTIGCDHGCAHTGAKDTGFFSEPSGFGTRSHGSGSDGCAGVMYPETKDVQQQVYSRALDGITSADCVFAWIEDAECYGTLVEIGYAAALGKRIFIAIAPDVEPKGELWFALQAAEMVRKYNNPKTAWEDAIRFVAQEPEPWVI